MNCASTPQSWAEDETDGWLGIFQELVALDGDQVQVELTRNTCLPSCADGFRMTYHLAFERVPEQFLVSACGVHEGELHPVEPPVDVTYDTVLADVDEFCGP